MLKFRTELLAGEVIACQVLLPLSQEEAQQCVQGVEKLLKHGKNKILFEFSTEETAQGSYGAVFFEKKMKPFQFLAQKTGGHLCYLVPASSQLKEPIFLKDRHQALATFGGPSVLLSLQEKEHLLEENRWLKKQLAGAFKGWTEPQSTQEMKQALEFYRTLTGVPFGSDSFFSGATQNESIS